MVRVMATGVFDLLHPGHLHYLSEARKLGDELVVVVARDSTAKRLKREPVVSEEARRLLVDALKPVDRAILGATGDIYESVVNLRPDIIALGFDQRWDTETIRQECAKRGIPVKVIRLSARPEGSYSSNKIVERIAERNRNETTEKGV